MMDVTTQAWIQLLTVRGLGPQRLARLVDALCTPRAVLKAKFGTLQELGIPEKTIDAMRASSVPENVMTWAQQPRHHVVTVSDDGYPPQLSDINGAPPVLFVQGNPDALLSPQLAIVGSRNPTVDGKGNARQFARALAASGLTITSGMAAGIDSESHWAALKAGQTIAVLGCGSDVVYPKSNRDLHAAIEESSGCVISEFLPGTPPKREFFPRRNRLISGLSLGTLVIEAGVQSGSLITARLASEQGREVFALPGSIHNPMARGCHRLIKQGAKLIETTAEIIEDLQSMAQQQGAALRERIAAVDNPEQAPNVTQSDDPEYAALLNHLGHDPVSVDTLAERSGLTAQSICSMLLIMELRGEVSSHPGGRYAINVVRQE